MFFAHGASAAWVTDSFTDTAGTLLENHTSDTSNTWAKQSGTNNAVITNNNRVREGSGFVVYVSNFTPATADYDISANLYSADGIVGNYTGIGGRCGTSAYTGYYALLSSGSLITLYRGGLGTILATSSVTFATGQTHVFRMEMRTNEIKVYWDGNVVIDKNTTGVEIVSAVGVPCLFFQQSATDSTGVHIDDFQANDPGTGPLTAGILSESSHTATSATVSWVNATGGTAPISAQLQRSPTGAGTWADVVGAVTSPVTDEGLIIDTIYDYRVAYTDVDDTVAYSNIITVSTVNLLYDVRLVDLWDNGYDNVAAPRQSPFARFVFTTDAASITVTGTTTIYGGYAGYAHLGVLANGVALSPLAFTANGNQTFNVSLGSVGINKTVEIVTGLQSTIGGATSFGSFINSITHPSAASFSVQTPTVGDRVLFYGDSILVGGNATNPEYQGYVNLLRTSYSKRTMVEGWGYRSLYDDANTAGLQTAFINRVAGYTPLTIWFAIGTNDYGLNKWNAASFGTAYAAVLDGLHTALPSIRIVCQTPLTSSSESANGSGSTLGDYRSQITTICSARSWTTLVDGTTFLTISDLADGLHPSTAGHAKYALAINNILDILGDATLSNLAISSGTLTPTFASGTTSYTDSVANSVASVTVTPTVNQANATVTVNGTAVTSGSASGAIALSVGSNTITTIVTAQDGSTIATYTITVTRAGSTDATLSNLAISSGTLTPVFASGTTTYTDSVANDVTSVTVTPTVNQGNATITVNGTAVTSGSASGAIALSVGSNTITVVVTAQDGTTTATYTITVTRVAATGGGGGMPSGAYLPPIPPVEGFKISINNGANTTSSQQVTLFLTAGSNTMNAAISNTPDFNASVQEPFRATKQWTLTPGNGTKTVYVKFYTGYGYASEVVQASIYYQAGAQTPAQPTVDLSDIVSIQREIQRLQNLIQELFSQNIFTKDLRLNMVDLQVKLLQQYLNTHGFTVATTGPGSAGNETTFFGSLTKAAVIRFQEAYASEILAPLGLTRGTGIVAGYTRAKLNGK